MSLLYAYSDTAEAQAETTALGFQFTEPSGLTAELDAEISDRPLLLGDPLPDLVHLRQNRVH